MGISWLKTGSESAKAAQQNEADMEKAKEERGKMFRFFLKDKESAKITFVDGELSNEGVLLPPRFFEHFVQVNGSSGTFVCPEKNNPSSGEKCPICAAGDRPSLVALFTIIDHRQFKRRDGTVGQDSPKIFAAKPQTFEMLNKIAIKRGGLAGARFEVSRTGDKSAAVGNMFDFEEKTDLAKLEQQYMKQVKDEKGTIKLVSAFKVADYENEIVYRSAEELMKMGLGVQHGGLAGSGYKPPSNSSSGQQIDASEHL